MELVGGVLPTVIKNLNDEKIILIKRPLLLKSKHAIVCTYCICKTAKETLMNFFESYLGISICKGEKKPLFFCFFNL